MTPFRSAPMGLTAALCLLLVACGGDEADAVDPRASLMRFCEASGYGACDCSVDLMLEALDPAHHAVVASLAEGAGEGADPEVLLLTMVEGGDLPPETARGIVETMSAMQVRIAEECGE